MKNFANCYPNSLAIFFKVINNQVGVIQGKFTFHGGSLGILVDKNVSFWSFFFFFFFFFLAKDRIKINMFGV